MAAFNILCTCISFLSSDSKGHLIQKNCNVILLKNVSVFSHKPCPEYHSIRFRGSEVCLENERRQQTRVSS